EPTSMCHPCERDRRFAVPRFLERDLNSRSAFMSDAKNCQARTGSSKSRTTSLQDNTTRSDNTATRPEPYAFQKVARRIKQRLLARRVPSILEVLAGRGIKKRYAWPPGEDSAPQHGRPFVAPPWH